MVNKSIWLDDVKNKIEIYENTRVISLERKNNYWINNHLIKANTIILACHYPFFLTPYFFPFKTTVEKSFLIASKTEHIQLLSAINIDSNTLSFRHNKNKQNQYFIFCSKSNNLSKNINNLKVQKKND